MRGKDGRPAAGIAVVFALLVVVLLYVVPRSIALRLLGQGGPVETVELLFYAVSFLLVARDRRFPADLRIWMLLGLVLLALLEWNPGRRIERLVEITPQNPGDPAGVRWVGVVGLGLAGAVVLGGLLARTRGTFLGALRAGRPEARLAAVGAVLIPLAFVLDRYHATHLVWNRGYRLTRGVGFAAHVVEETSELLVPALFALALALHRRRGSSRGPETRPSIPGSDMV